MMCEECEKEKVCPKCDYCDYDIPSNAKCIKCASENEACLFKAKS